MTQSEKSAKADQSLKLVKKSIQSLKDGMKDKDDHIRVLELTIGRLYKWTYAGTETGVVDQKLVDAIILKRKEYEKNWREQRRQGALELAGQTIVTANGITKLPSGKKDNVEQVKQWLKQEVSKNEQIPGYLRGTESIMYPRIIEIIDGLGDLKMVVEKLHL